MSEERVGKNTFRRKAVAFFKRRTRKGNRYCLFLGGWSLVYIPLATWMITTADEAATRALYGFVLLCVGFAIGAHRMGHAWRRSSTAWDWLSHRQGRWLRELLTMLDAHQSEHRLGWWELSDKGRIGKEREH